MPPADRAGRRYICRFIIIMSWSLGRTTTRRVTFGCQLSRRFSALAQLESLPLFFLRQSVVVSLQSMGFLFFLSNYLEPFSLSVWRWAKRSIVGSKSAWLQHFQYHLWINSYHCYYVFFVIKRLINNPP